MSDTIKIGLALGGGGARGLGHIPIIAALEELGLKVSAIAGTSIGSLIGVAYASGMDWQNMRDYFLETFTQKNEVASRLWSTKPQSFKELWSRGIRVSQFNLEVILSAFLPKNIPSDFSDLLLPLHIIAADLHSAKMIVMKEGDLYSALAASAAMPGVFKPVRRDGFLLTDGGTCNPIPFDCIPGKCDLTIGVDIIGFKQDCFVDRFPTTIEALMAANMCAQKALMETRFKVAMPDLLLYPPVNGIYVLDFLKTKKILETVMPYKEEAKYAIAQAIEAKLRCN